MENFDLIEQYLAGKLEGNEKEIFEQKMSQDSELKSEVDFQRQVIDSVKKARATELKRMLANAPTPSLMEFSALKIAASIIGGGALLATVYFLYQPDSTNLGSKVSSSIEDSISGKVLLDSGTKAETLEVPKVEQSAPVESKEQEGKKPTPSVQSDKPDKPSVPQKGKIDVMDPTDELSSKDSEDASVSNNLKPAIRPASIEVDVERTDKKYSFHYQFAQGKLVLFGAFDKGLYEVIEINSDSRSIFLYYKSAYHLLDESKVEITPLVPVQNQTIIRKLDQYRAQ